MHVEKINEHDINEIEKKLRKLKIEWDSYEKKSLIIEGASLRLI